jgi:hypothetical protein
VDITAVQLPTIMTVSEDTSMLAAPALGSAEVLALRERTRRLEVAGGANGWSKVTLAADRAYAGYVESRLLTPILVG